MNRPSQWLRRRAGLTLLEAICVTAIVAMMLALLMGIVTATVRETNSARATMHSQRVATGVERVIRQDMAGACAVPDKKLSSFVGRPASSYEVEPAMEFFTLHTLGGRPGIIRRVAYSLRRSETDTPDEETYVLFRQESPYTPGEPLPDSPRELLASGIVGCDLRFYDGTQWQESWKRDALPVLVRATLALRDETGSESRSIFFFAPVADNDGNPLPPT